MAYPGYKGIGPNRIGCSPAKHTGLLTSKAHKKLHQDPNFSLQLMKWRSAACAPPRGPAARRRPAQAGARAAAAAG